MADVPLMFGGSERPSELSALSSLSSFMKLAPDEPIQAASVVLGS
jgi:hypothetical protein